VLATLPGGPAAALGSRGGGGAMAHGRFVEPPSVTVGDSDGDGLPEASVVGTAGGPCACRCPVMGGDVDAGAAGQVATAGTRTALVVCGTRVAAGLTPKAPDPLVTPRVGGRLYVDPGGLGLGGPSG
jgi:hypothetical protein